VGAPIKHSLFVNILIHFGKSMVFNAERGSGEAMGEPGYSAITFARSEIQDKKPNLQTNSTLDRLLMFVGLILVLTHDGQQ
jgi:hypothetical protein